MTRSSSVGNFTGETLAWFREGEELEVGTRTVPDEVARPGRLRVALQLVLLVALLGVLAALVAPQFGLALDLPWEIPWELPFELPRP